MSSPFLLRFASSLVHTLLREDLVELREGGLPQAIDDLATGLGQVQTGSLISSATRVLIASEAVEELWADDDQLKAIVESMGAGVIRQG